MPPDQWYSPVRTQHFTRGIDRMGANPSPEAVLTVQDVSKSFGAQPVLNEVSLTLHEGDRIGLIGNNGAGKSTLLKIMAGLDSPDAGVVTRKQGLRIAMLSQVCGLDHRQRLGDALEGAAASVRRLLAQHRLLSEKLAALPADAREHARLAEELAELDRHLDVADAWHLDRDVKKASIALRLPEPDRPLDTLSGGERRRAELAVALLQRPDVLLLDEPTNHIDVNTIEWLEAFLARHEGSCVFATHDRYFLERVSNRIVEVERRSLYSTRGSYRGFLKYKAERAAYEARAEANRLAALQRELAWLRRGAKARTTKQKARIQRYRALDTQDDVPAERVFTFAIPSPRRLGKCILEADHIARAYDDTTLFRDLSLIMQKEMRVGVVGPSGCGKTTLLRTLMGEEAPDAGAIVRGEATEFLYVDQGHEAIDPDRTILEHVSGGTKELDVRGRRIYVPVYLEQFLFDQAAVDTPMRNLSGGERSRIDLAKKLLRGGNFLMLDEPTNDLDLATLRVLEEAVEAFEGCAMIVSHDRYFLDRVCTHMLVFEGDGRVVQVAGNYEDHLTFCEKRAATHVSARPRPPDKPSKRVRTGQAQRRLTWAEKRELERIEQDIAAAEEALAALRARIEEPSFYQGDYAAVRETLAAFEKAQAQVDALYARWQELEQIPD